MRAVVERDGSVEACIVQSYGFAGGCSRACSRGGRGHCSLE